MLMLPGILHGHLQVRTHVRAPGRIQRPQHARESWRVPGWGCSVLFQEPYFQGHPQHADHQHVQHRYWLSVRHPARPVVERSPFKRTVKHSYRISCRVAAIVSRSSTHPDGHHPGCSAYAPDTRPFPSTSGPSDRDPQNRRIRIIYRCHLDGEPRDRKRGVRQRASRHLRHVPAEGRIAVEANLFGSDRIPCRPILMADWGPAARLGDPHVADGRPTPMLRCETGAALPRCADRGAPSSVPDVAYSA